MYFRGLGNLCSSAVYNQGPLTSIFTIISCGLKSRAANNQENTLSTFSTTDKSKRERCQSGKTYILQTMTPWNVSYGPSSENGPGFALFNQDRIKGEGNCPGPPLSGTPVMTFIWYKWNLRLNNCHESKEIQETTLYSVVALSIINDFSASLTFCQF